MDLRIFDKQLNALGVIDEAASVIWTVRYFDVGEFKILAPITDNNRELLVRDRVVVKHDKYTDYYYTDILFGKSLVYHKGRGKYDRFLEVCEWILFS